MFQALFRTIFIFLVFWSLSTPHTASAEDSAEHDASADGADNSDADEKVNAAKQKIVEARPTVGALGTLLQGISPTMTNDKFSQLVERTRGLNDVQKSALKTSFQSIASDPNQKGQAGAQFLKVVGGALAELDATGNTPGANSGQPVTPGAGGAAGQAGGAPGVGGQAAIPEQLKAIQEELKKSGESRQGQLSRLREQLLAKGREGEEGKNGQGRNDGGQGQNGQGQNQGQNPGQNPGQSGGENGNNSGGGNGRALSQLAKALGGNNDKKNNVTVNTPPQQQSNGNANGQKEKEKPRASASGSEPEPFSTASGDKDKKKKEPAVDTALKQDSNPPPQKLTTSQFKLSGGKTPLSAIQNSSSYGGNFGAFSGPGLAGLGDSSPPGFGGAPISGVAPSGISSGGDLGSMRFDSDSFGGPMMGLPKLSSGPIYGPGGGGDNGGNEVEGAGSEIEPSKAPVDLTKYRQTLVAPTEASSAGEFQGLKGSIIDRHFGKMVRQVCTESSGQVAACFHPRAKIFLKQFSPGRI